MSVDRNVALIRQIIAQESPSRIELGTVVAADLRGTRNIAVRLHGGRVSTRCYTCTDDIEIGNEVVVARVASRERLIILGRILSAYESPLSRNAILAPPEKLQPARSERGY